MSNIAFPQYPECTPEIIEAVTRQLQSGQWTRLEGAPELERQWESYLGSGHAWFIASGTAALEAVFLGHGIQAGDEIVTTAYTWGASVSAILAVGAIPVFADIDFWTGQIDPASVRAAITPRTKAILAVHLFGTPSPATELRRIAREHGLPLFEDASQAHGATLNRRKVGTIGEASAFSCMGLKPLGATEGGFAVFKSPQARERAYLYGRHPRGIDPGRVTALAEAGLLDTLQLGWRPCALSAAILSVRLPHLDEENRGRRNNARWLREELDGLPDFILPDEPPDCDPVYHLLSFIVDPDRSRFRTAEVLSRLREAGLPVFPYIPVPVHRMKRLRTRDYEGPPVMWHAAIEKSAVDYASLRLPETEKRSKASIEMAWNFIREDRETMRALGSVIRKALR